MSSKVRLFLLLSGLFIFFSWGFRLYVLTIRWETDPLRVWTISFATLFVLIGLFLIRLAKLGPMANRRDYIQLICIAIFIILYWGYRLLKLILYPDIDPNPRAHLHLSATFLVIGGFLLLIGWKGKRDKKRDKKLTEPIPLG